jgi:TonB family protein
MIRLFAPPTRDAFLRADPVTVTNLVVHIAASIALLVPLGKVAKEELFDRLIVYLVPPDKPGTRDLGKGEVVYNSVAADPGFAKGSPAPPSTPTEAIPAKGTMSTPDATEVDAAVGPLPSDNALTVLEVDSAVVRDPTSAAPEYPAHLIAQGIEGSASVRFVVDTAGVPDSITFRVVRASHYDFAAAVRRALSGMHFRPAIRGGIRVRQLVEQTFTFRIAPRDTLTPAAPTPPPA